VVQIALERQSKAEPTNIDGHLERRGLHLTWSLPEIESH